jgi:CspA family cold shock protein
MVGIDLFEKETYLDMNGTVKWFNDQKGYGFITNEDGSGDVFVHYSGIATEGFKTLSEHDVVSYDVEPSDKGDRAVNVIKTGVANGLEQQLGKQEEPVKDVSSTS